MAGALPGAVGTMRGAVARSNASSRGRICHRARAEARCLSVRPFRALFHQKDVLSRPQAAVRPTLAMAAGQSESTAVEELQSSLLEAGSIPPQKAQASSIQKREGSALIYNLSQDVQEGQVIMEVPSKLAVTSYDVGEHPTVAALAEGRSELIGLALWLLAERAKGADSACADFLKSLPETTLTPLKWTDDERFFLLRGTSIQTEATDRRAAILEEWATLQSGRIADQPDVYPPDVYNEEAFLDAFAAVLASACFLPSANCFALMPLLSSIRHSGAGTAYLDYDQERDAAVLVAMTDLQAGAEVTVYDDRPNGEMLLSTGSVEPSNPCDCLTVTAELVKSDGLYMAKRMVLDAYNFDDIQVFPLYKDRMPTQLLAYLRLARVQNAAEIAKVNFETDSEVSQMNEYETLQILMADCRDILSGFQGNIEDDQKEMYNPDLTEKERVAIQLRIEEKIIAQSTMDAVRRKLAPIRGIPTKRGMQDPNQDLVDIFQTIENIPNAPKKLFDGIAGWARGDYDPEWRKKKR